MRVYAIGDVHGQLQLLREAHDRIAADGGTEAPIVHVGDLIDRGPDSRGVVQMIIDGQAEGRPWIVVKGNHDRELPRFLRNPRWIDPRASEQKPWLERDSGAVAALASYGVDAHGGRPLDEIHADALRAVPAEHARWLDGLPIWHLTPLALFVHAGIRPGIDLHAQIEDDLLWLRRPFFDDPRDHGVLVVHGHTPVRRPMHCGNRLNIDTGAGHDGPLTAVRLDRDGVWVLGRDGAERLDPP